jgi:DNA replication protein DnaC
MTGRSGSHDGHTNQCRPQAVGGPDVPVPGAQAPLAASIDRLAERARTDGWTHEEFLAACLEREVAARQDHGGEARIRAARFPARKTLEDFDYDHQRSLKRDTVLHLGTLDFVAERANVVFLGPPGTGKTHLAIGLSIRACQAGHRVAFATAAEWVARLADAHTQGRLQAELTRLGRIPLLVIDEVGYIQYDAWMDAVRKRRRLAVKAHGLGLADAEIGAVLGIDRSEVSRMRAMVRDEARERARAKVKAKRKAMKAKAEREQQA